MRVCRTMSRYPSDSLLFADLPEGPDFETELRLHRRGLTIVAGLDEAGRGPLAGPVVAAAAVLNPDNIPDGLHDSKQLSARQREALFDVILRVAHVSVATSSAATIDRTDIRKASLDAMRRALAGLPVDADYALVDGRDVPMGLPCPADALIKGDARSVSISAASIVAKVTRDRLMARAAMDYPNYGFEQHAGYATAMHRNAIAKYGPCPIHRMSFRPIRKD